MLNSGHSFLLLESSGVDQTPVLCPSRWRGHSWSSHSSSRDIPLTWLEVEGSTPLISSVYVFHREKGLRAHGQCPQRNPPSNQLPSRLRGQVRHLRMIRDHLLLKSCLGGPALECRGDYHLSLWGLSWNSSRTSPMFTALHVNDVINPQSTISAITVFYI